MSDNDGVNGELDADVYVDVEPKNSTHRSDSAEPAELARLTSTSSPESDTIAMLEEVSDTNEEFDRNRSPNTNTTATTATTRTLTNNINNGHLDPTKRTRYLIIFVISTLISLLGLALIFVWIFKIRPKPGIGFSNAAQLTNLHPILMYTFMATLNMYSVLIYRTHYDKPKGILKIMHAIIMATCIVTGILGVLAIFKAHSMANMADWYSLHSWIGTLTLSLFLLQFIAGFVAFLKPGLSPRTRAQLMPWHRFSGVVIMILSALAVVTGIAEFAIFAGDDYNKFKPITFVANFAGICVVLSAMGLGYLLTEPAYLRPLRADEMQPTRR